MRSSPEVCSLCPQISDIYKVHVVSDCHRGLCSFGSVIVYIQPTNWFVQPESASLQSLIDALQKRALQLAKTKYLAASSHRNFLARSVGAWFSKVKAQVIAKVGSICFMRRKVSQGRNGSPMIKLQKLRNKSTLQSLFTGRTREREQSSPSDTLSSDSLRDALDSEEKFPRPLAEAPPNFLGVCRMPVSLPGSGF